MLRKHGKITTLPFSKYAGPIFAQKKSNGKIRLLVDLRKRLTDAESRAKFLENFDWKDSTLTPEEKEKIEELLVEFHDIFARHRFDIGMNEEFKVKLTPKDDSPAYSQKPSSSYQFEGGHPS